MKTAEQMAEDPRGNCKRHPPISIILKCCLVSLAEQALIEGRRAGLIAAAELMESAYWVTMRHVDVLRKALNYGPVESPSGRPAGTVPVQPATVDTSAVYVKKLEAENRDLLKELHRSRGGWAEEMDLMLTENAKALQLENVPDKAPRECCCTSRPCWAYESGRKIRKLIGGPRMTVDEVKKEVEAALCDLAPLFVPGAQLSFVMRVPSDPNGPEVHLLPQLLRGGLLLRLLRRLPEPGSAVAPRLPGQVRRGIRAQHRAEGHGWRWEARHCPQRQGAERLATGRRC